MSKHKKWIYIAVGSVGTLALAITGLFLVTNIAAAAGGPTSAASVPAVSVLYPGPGDGSGSYDEALAEALGISTDELNAAYADAYRAAIEQAVADDNLTESQAQRLLDQLDSADAFHFGWFGLHGMGGNLDQYLADALGISVDELAAARQEANQTLIQDAVDAGDLTQDEADLLLGRQALGNYLPDALTTAYENAVQQALDDGAITEAQAQLLLDNAPTWNHEPSDGLLGGMPGFRGGHGGMMGPGLFGPRGSSGGSQGTSPQDGVNGGFGFGGFEGA